MLLYFARQNDAALRELRTLADLHPDDPRVLWLQGDVVRESLVARQVHRAHAAPTERPQHLVI